MKPMNKVSIAEFRNHVFEIIRRVNRLGHEVVITDKGKPAAVLIAYAEWESIVETLAIKQDPELMSQLQSSKKYFRHGGKGISLDKIDWGKS